MSVPSSALEKAVEERIVSFLRANLILPSPGYAFLASHSIEKQEAEDVDIIVVKAGLPDWSAAQGEAAEIMVEIYPSTNVADPDDRDAAAEKHQGVLGDILDLFAYQNFETTLAALNGMQEGIGFDGWEFQSDSDDGQSQSEKSLMPKLRYLFEVFLFDAALT